ncbi:hypothetical protein J2785_003228 [Burkholderia ambifaria]|nr:hypothetical protein [Burkholderia ambifaria]
MLSSFSIMLSLYSMDEFLDLREASETKKM